MAKIEHYGVHEQVLGDSVLDVMEEQIRLLGYTTLASGFTESQMDVFSTMFDAAAGGYADNAAQKGYDLKALSENDTIRLLPAEQPEFWNVAFNPALHQLLERLLGGYYILNQANGLINRGNNSEYHQSKYHRDLPYQHFTSSRPLAINALFALDDFTLENGATRVIPASHKRESFPPGALVHEVEKQVTVKRGTFIVLDCMVYHAGSTNTTQHDRRGINHVFTIPLLRQQLHLPSILGDGAEFDGTQKKILGYGLEEFRSVDAWLDTRR